MRLLTLRWYARAPIRVATLTHATFRNLLDARPGGAACGPGVLVVRLREHKTASTHGPADLFIFEEDAELARLVSLVVFFIG